MEIFNRRHAMIDLETLSTRVNGTVVSIGVVEFDFNKGVGREFSVNIDVNSSRDLGLHVSKSTVQWWIEQPKEIRDSWKVDPVEVPRALNMLNEWFSSVYGRMDKVLVWANGSAFDHSLMRNLYDTTAIQIPWKYWNEMDLRTLSGVLGIKLSKGNAHTAVGDARNQAEQLVKMMNP